MDKNIIIILAVTVLCAISIWFFVLQWGFEQYDEIDCWECDELLKIEATTFNEAIISVAKGDLNSKKVVELNLSECGAQIHLNKTDTCWQIIAKSQCSGIVYEECIDISKDIEFVKYLPIEAMGYLQNVDVTLIKSSPTRINISNSFFP